MENLIIQVMLMKINERILLQQFLHLSEAEIQGFLHAAKVSRGYYLAWFPSLQLPFAQ
jgi:hypothetical protein